MCRTTDNHGFYYQYQRDRLKIKAFHLRLSITNTRKSLPESLTLHYLPRISGTPLEINDSKIRSDSDAFVTLHRVRSAEKKTKEAVFASRERVRAGEAVRFEVYLREEKVLKGIFRKDEGEWKLECECVLERGDNKCLGVEIGGAEVSVVTEGHVALVERVDMRRRKKCRRGFKGLDEIPEEKEEGFSDDESDGGCDCCCGEMEIGSDGEDVVEMEMEGVRWAVDVGIWVMCLGVGYLVSKASAKSMRRRMIL